MRALKAAAKTKGQSASRTSKLADSIANARARGPRVSGSVATQFTVLALLIQTKPLAISHLANELGVERTTLTRILRQLERRKLITVSGDRARLVSITPAGERLAVETLPRWRQAQETVGQVPGRFNLPFAVKQNFWRKIKEPPKKQKNDVRSSLYLLGIADLVTAVSLGALSAPGLFAYSTASRAAL